MYDIVVLFYRIYWNQLASLQIDYKHTRLYTAATHGRIRIAIGIHPTPAPSYVSLK